MTVWVTRRDVKVVKDATAFPLVPSWRTQCPAEKSSYHMTPRLLPQDAINSFLCRLMCGKARPLMPSRAA